MHAILFLAMLLPADPAASEFSYDFRGGNPVPPEMKLFGPDADLVVSPDRWPEDHTADCRPAVAWVGHRTAVHVHRRFRGDGPVPNCSLSNDRPKVVGRAWR